MIAACTETSSPDDLAADDELSFPGKGARDRDPLLLSAGQLMRVASRVVRRQVDPFEHRGDRPSSREGTSDRTRRAAIADPAAIRNWNVAS